MRTINFSYNWNNKLDNKVFTTIRSRFIPIEPGTSVTIALKNKTYCFAKVKECILCKFADINPLIIYLDTGYSPAEAYEIFKNMGLDINDKNQDCMLMIFERAHKPIDQQLRDLFTKQN